MVAGINRRILNARRRKMNIEPMTDLMPLNTAIHKKLDRLISGNLSLVEGASTLELMKYLAPVKKRGWLTKRELEEICMWKSPRAIWHVRSNSIHAVKKYTGIGLTSRREKEKMEALTSLRGV